MTETHSSLLTTSATLDFDTHEIASVTQHMVNPADIADSAFLDMAKSFISGMPGTDPFIVLLLGNQHTVLETMVHGAVALEASRMSWQSGSRFTIPLSIRSDYEESPIHAFSSTHIVGQEWQGVSVSMVSSGVPERFESLIVLMKQPVPTRMIEHLAMCIAYSLQQLWCMKHEVIHAERDASNDSPGDFDLETRTIEQTLQEFEKISSLATLSAGIAHEIRNPLTTARGFLQLFERRCGPEDKDYLKLTIHELDRIQELLEDFMGMSRPGDEAFHHVDLRKLVQSVHHFLSPEASLCNVQLSHAVPAEPVVLQLQVGRIKQVLINLVQNAVHACENQGQVRLALEAHASHITITISDTGCGIADMHQLFRPFHTTKSNGTGLGMFVSKHIIEGHRGHIRVDSVINQGTTITIYLPRETM